MTAKNLKNIEPYLEDSGFIIKGADTFALDSHDVHRLGRHELPWTLSDWVIRGQGHEYVQDHFAARLDRADVVANIEAMMQSNMVSFRAVAALADKQSGFWLLFEFCDPELEADQSRIIEEERLHNTQLPHGLAGLHVTILQSQGMISLYMTKHFFLGNVPGKLFLELPRIISLSSFGSVLKEEIQYNAFSSTVSCTALRQALIRACELPQDLQQRFESEALDETQIRLDDRKGEWSLAWEEGHELPPLVIPSIEVLEQKEVARRYHRLDTLIVQEDYEQAINQCYEYLAKSPQSLYLIRRLAFLTLWAQRPLERHYLEIMSKYDAQNLMSISMWVRAFLQEQQHHQSLEFLSRLGNNLGLTIIDFEVADITSLTLPEMLGDAWNVKDDKRAIACYERVLQARGEVPRILVKLIRLMRDLDDPQAEELYMDRLLACEVPVRTRAAIYFRLAEIKEKIDQEEAVHWALKSWQTKRSHVRYALLASRLLLALQRPHEAVHVLVETSDLLAEHENTSTRLDLELQIATIWFDHLQRYDLAAERLSRARELAGDDPQSLNRMAHIAEHLGDHTQHVDLLLMAFDTAVKAADKVRADLVVASLIDLAGDIVDAGRQSQIYTIILTHHLLEAPRIAEILANTKLDLPYESILEVLGKMIAEKPAKEQGPYFEVLGKICSERLNRQSEARAYYESVVRAGYFSPVAFEYLDAAFAQEGLNSERHMLLNERFKLAPASEKPGILRDLFYFDGVVSEAERDSYAVQIFASDADDIGPLEERISGYQQVGQAVSLAQLLENVISAAPSSPGLRSILELGAHAISSCPEKDRFTSLQRIFGKLTELQNDSLANARMALNYFWADPDKAYVAQYLDTLIRNGELPDLDPDEMLAVLRDDVAKVTLLISLAPLVSENRAIGYLRRALRIGRKLQVSFEIQQKIMRKLSALTILQEDEIDDFVNCAKGFGEVSQILPLISQQLKLVQDNTSRAKLCSLVAEFIVDGPIDEVDLDVICKSLSILPRDQQSLVKIRWLEVRGFDARLHTKEFALEFLSEINNWESRKATLELIERLWNEDRLGAVKVANLALQSFVDNASYEQLEYYFAVLEKLDLLDESILYQVFEAFAKKPDPKRAEQCLVQALSRTKKATEAEKWLNSAQELLVLLDMPQVFQDVLVELLDPTRQVAPLHPHVQREVGLCHARWQVMQGKDSRKALGLLEQMYAVDQNDPRLWGPLIVIYRELNADTDLYELLYRSMPMIRSNPSITKPFNIDLLQLEQDLIGMGQRLGLMREQTDVTLTMATQEFPGDSSQAAELLGPYGTAVINPLDPRDVATVAHDTLKDPSSTAKDELLSFGQSADLDAEQATHKLDLSFSNIFRQGDKPGLPSGPKPPEPPRHGDYPDAREAMNLPGLGFSPALAEDEELTKTVAIAQPVPPMPNMVGFSISLPAPIPSPVLDSAFEVDLAKEEKWEEGKSLIPLPSRSGDTKAPIPLPPELDSEEGKRNPHILFEADDWKVVAAQGKSKPGLCAWLLQHPFSDKAEQHLAVQVAALSEDRVSLLDSWAHRVWRHPQEIFYELRWADHMGREMFHPGMKAPLTKLLKTLQPLISQQFASTMSSKSGAERLKMRLEDLHRVRRSVEWSDEIFQRSLLRSYAKNLSEAGYTVYHLPRLDERIHFHIEEREIYFDREYYLANPPSHLMHRLIFLSRSMQLDCYLFLNLSPHNDIYPFLLKCRRSLEQNRMDNVRRMLGMEKDPLKLILSQSDREHLDMLFAEVGTLTPDKIAKTCNVFVEQIYRINVAETLDLVGLLEAITNVNALDPYTATAVHTQQNPLIRHLMAFCSDLKFAHRSGLS